MNRNMIQNLQQQSTAAVTAITRGRTDAEYCVGHTEELVASLSQVTRAITHMTTLAPRSLVLLSSNWRWVK
ncbi:MAG: hypothetical protein U5L01_17380 [Rheinheimera sp.]|nr:hypothetical protein [Rheinheimera sp.]